MDAGIRFLVATDVHLGHREKHAVRQNDSYEGFEQVIEHAKELQVDFLLLGGDLFDEVNPSKECFFKCLSILKESVFGSKTPALHVSLNGRAYRTNFEDPDLHISLPIFTIHGNHDYPTNEFGKISACDLLQASNYVNYFGKHLDLRQIVIRPLIITKRNSTARIALYGLGYIKDQILNELFEEKKVAFEQPEGGIADCLCLFVFHQNRYKKGFKAGTPIHQSFNPRNIPEWMSLVIWGHEHEAIYKLEEEFGRPVYQPGSTVLTSYIESESTKKQCLLVKVAPSGKYELSSILLERSYRPMKCLSFQYQTLQAQFGQDFDLFLFLEGQVEKVLEEVGGTRKPIVRMKVQVTGLVDTVKARQVETRFADRVANGEKILQLWRRKVENKTKVDDNEMLSKLKSRQPMRISSGIADELDGILRNHFDKVTTAILPKESLVQVVSYLGKTDNTNASEIIRKKCEEMERHKTQKAAESLTRMGREKEGEFKRTLKYYMDRKEYISTGKLDQTLYPSCNTPEDFLAYKSMVITENKFALNCKLMEEKVEEPLSGLPNSASASGRDPPSNPNSKANSIPSSAFSARTKKEERDSSVEIVDRSDSEDCCSRAEKTQFDETGNKLRYVQAQEKIKASNIAKSKRSALANSKQELKSEQKSVKQVRFSDTGRKADLDFM